MSMKNDWTYRGKTFEPDETFDPKRVYGFVYCITNDINQRKYIGKKLFWSKKTKMVKKKKKRLLVESDWRDYCGSCESLRKDIVEHGVEKFSREILWMCVTKAHCTYMEMKEQIDRDVLLSDQYYNGYVGGRINEMHLTRVSSVLMEQIAEMRKV